MTKKILEVKNELSKVAFLNTIQNRLRLIGMESLIWFHHYDILGKEGEQIYGGLEASVGRFTMQRGRKKHLGESLDCSDVYTLLEFTELYTL